MRHTDIAVVGGGLAGSIAATMLGRAGLRVALIDPHTNYPPDFPCEKLDETQIRLFGKTGLADSVRRAATIDGQVWIAQFGRVVEKRPSAQWNILYEALVNVIRKQVPESVAFLCAKASTIMSSRDQQRVTLSNEEEISARLVVLADGLNVGLRHTLGITREIVSRCHSISIGFDIKPIGRTAFDFRALTYYGERASDRIAYMAIFPIGTSMRVNFFVYRDMDDPWLLQLRRTPQSTLFTAMPGLRKLTGDLYVTRGHRQPGIVLVGDAFATSCPAAGTGSNKVFTDVERLCNIYIPRWLATDGMGEEKISAFYDDPVKTACDAKSEAKAFYLRTFSINTGWTWRARRGASP
jgi:2-polyprenyl-6-methoxyphenol hydroxylase-like FAD-dependent oxidoreductase